MPQAKITTRPFSRCRIAFRRMKGSAICRISIAVCSRVGTPIDSSVSWNASELMTVASIPIWSAVTRSISLPCRPRQMFPPPMITQTSMPMRTSSATCAATFFTMEKSMFSFPFESASPLIFNTTRLYAIFVSSRCNNPPAKRKGTLSPCPKTACPARNPSMGRIPAKNCFRIYYNKALPFGQAPKKCAFLTPLPFPSPFRAKSRFCVPCFGKARKKRREVFPTLCFRLFADLCRQMPGVSRSSASESLLRSSHCAFPGPRPSHSGRTAAPGTGRRSSWRRSCRRP